MVLVIRDNTIYSPDGKMLKKISCPQKMKRSNLADGINQEFKCEYCSEKVLNTDYISENDLVDILKKNPKTCLFINLANPIFAVRT